MRGTTGGIAAAEVSGRGAALHAVRDLLTSGEAVLLDFRFDVRYGEVLSAILRPRDEVGVPVILQNPAADPPSYVDQGAMLVGFSELRGDGRPAADRPRDPVGRTLLRPEHYEVLSLLESRRGPTVLVHDSASGFLSEFGLRRSYRFFRGILDELDCPGIFVWFSWIHDRIVNSIMRDLFSHVVSVYGGGILVGPR